MAQNGVGVQNGHCATSLRGGEEPRGRRGRKLATLDGLTMGVRVKCPAPLAEHDLHSMKIMKPKIIPNWLL